MLACSRLFLFQHFFFHSTLPQQKFLLSFVVCWWYSLFAHVSLDRSGRNAARRTTDYEESWCEFLIVTSALSIILRYSLLFSVLSFSWFYDSFPFMRSSETSYRWTGRVCCWVYVDCGMIRELEYAIETSYDFEEARREARRAANDFLIYLYIYSSHIVLFAVVCWGLWKKNEEREKSQQKDEWDENKFFCLRYLRNLSGTEVG